MVDDYGTVCNIQYYANCVDDVWLYLYEILHNQDIYKNSRDGDIVGEILNCSVIISDPTKNIMKNEYRELSMRYAVGEFLWYLSGSNSLSEIQKYTKNWDRMSDDGKTVNSNYGWCIKEKFGFDQFDYVYNLLKENPETRQAVIHIKTADNRKSKDVNCTVCLQFFIRNNRLYLTTYMRSNDIWFGFPYDVFVFTNLQIIMSMKLGIPLGHYTHIAGSLHLYARDKIINFK